MKKFIAVCGLLALMLAAPAQSALRIDITQGAEGALPIAIVPFGDAGGQALPLDIASVVEEDLGGTGLFDPYPRQDMLAQPHSQDAVNYGNWRTVNVDNLVVGSVADNGRGGYRISFQILDVYQGRAMTGYQITAGKDQLRQAAHKIANLIYQEFIGKKGYFLSRIAYITAQQSSPDNIRYRLVVSDYDGKNAQTIKSSKDPLLSPSWSPEGDRLAYVAFEVKRGRTSLRVHNLNTGGYEEISSRPGINGAPAWSPDGNKLAIVLSYRGNPEIYSHDLGSSRTTQLTFNGAIDTEPTWSPDGEYIAFTSDRGGKPQIYRMRTDGSQIERVTFSGESNQRASYSPDGEKLTMVQGGGNGFRIAVLDLSTNNINVISNGPLDESPSFSPNGQKVIYTRQGGGRADLATVSVDGKVRSTLSQPGDVREPAWSPGGD